MFNHITRHANRLIFIFMNINEKLKIAYILHILPAANCPRLPNVVPNLFLNIAILPNALKGDLSNLHIHEYQ